jgi:CheY-like chemotaxis protein
MRVVVVNEKQPERQVVERALGRVAIAVDAVGDGKAAVLAMQREPAHAIVLAWPATGGPELVQLLRSADTTGQAYLLAIVDSIQPGRDIAAALGAGVHDFLRRPLFEDEVAARVQAPARMLRWAKSVSRTSAYDWSSQFDFENLRAWKCMGSIVAEDFGQLLGETVEPTDGWPAGVERALRGATIAMSLATERTEIRVSIVADPTALALLSESLLGDRNADRNAQDDLMRELANTAGGSIKRAALPDDVTLTTGIPVSHAGARPHGPAKTRCWTLPIQKGRAALALVGEIHVRENLRVLASQLREGMVLVHDLRTESGALLVTAGTRLTSTTAERVGKILGSRFVVEVACAA